MSRAIRDALFPAAMASGAAVVDVETAEGLRKTQRKPALQGHTIDVHAQTSASPDADRDRPREGLAKKFAKPG